MKSSQRTNGKKWFTCTRWVGVVSVFLSSLVVILLVNNFWHSLDLVYLVKLPIPQEAQKVVMGRKFVPMESFARLLEPAWGIPDEDFDSNIWTISCLGDAREFHCNIYFLTRSDGAIELQNHRVYHEFSKSEELWGTPYFYRISYQGHFENEIMAGGLRKDFNLRSVMPLYPYALVVWVLLSVGFYLVFCPVARRLGFKLIKTF